MLSNRSAPAFTRLLISLSARIGGVKNKARCDRVSLSTNSEYAVAIQYAPSPNGWRLTQSASSSSAGSATYAAAPHGAR